MSKDQIICELCRLFGEALGVIKGASWNDNAGEDFQRQLAEIADSLEGKYTAVRDKMVEAYKDKPEKQP